MHASQQAYRLSAAAWIVMLRDYNNDTKSIIDILRVKYSSLSFIECLLVRCCIFNTGTCSRIKRMRQIYRFLWSNIELRCEWYRDVCSGHLMCIWLNFQSFLILNVIFPDIFSRTYTWNTHHGYHKNVLIIKRVFFPISYGFFFSSKRSFYAKNHTRIEKQYRIIQWCKIIRRRDFIGTTHHQLDY